MVHQQCDVNYIEIRRTAVWSYEFRRRIDRRVPPAEGTRPYEKLPIPTNLDIVHITLLVGGRTETAVLTNRNQHGHQTLVSLSLRLKDLLGPVTRVKKKKTWPPCVPFRESLARLGPTTRWSATISPKVNLQHANNSRALCGANLVT